MTTGLRRSAVTHSGSFLVVGVLTDLVVMCVRELLCVCKIVFRNSGVISIVLKEK